MSIIRKFIRKNLAEYHSIDGSRSVYPTNDKGKFPYDGIASAQRPEDIDVKANYFRDWTQLSNNNDVYEFPTEEFNLGLKVEKQRNPEMNMLTIADKVIQQLKGDNQFYSKLKDRYYFGRRPSNEI